jgi:filamentous hemagglutinin
LLSNDASTLAAAGGNDIQNHYINVSGNVFPNLYVLEPANFSAAALSGNLTSSNGFTMMPSSRGQIELLAAGSISLSDGATGAIRMLDIEPNALPNSYAPQLFDTPNVNVLNGSATGIAAHMLGGLHTGDKQPVEIVAVTGDIAGDSNNAATVNLPKFAEIQAGRDIVDLGFSIQQNSAADVTTITAGRDFIETTSAEVQQYDLPGSMKNIVTGPGRIDISAGRNVDFGNRGGLVTRGNLDNPYLPEGGANINIVAGARPDYAKLVSWLAQYGSVYSVIDVSASPTQQQQNDLIAYVGKFNSGDAASLTSANAFVV